MRKCPKCANTIYAGDERCFKCGTFLLVDGTLDTEKNSEYDDFQKRFSLAVAKHVQRTRKPSRQRKPFRPAMLVGFLIGLVFNIYAFIPGIFVRKRDYFAGVGIGAGSQLAIFFIVALILTAMGYM